VSVFEVERSRPEAGPGRQMLVLRAC
jgi:hypothetical protein